MIDKLDGQSMDIVKKNVEKLKELFPSIVKEDKIDFDELELLLGENINRSNEQYSFLLGRAKLKQQNLLKSALLVH